MQVFWKKNDKEEKDLKKREYKEALDRQRAEDEKREAARQARKLEFLISQTELYSHFVGSKLKSMYNLPICVGHQLTRVPQLPRSKKERELQNPLPHLQVLNLMT